ncbi:MAG TPA: cystathionine gamma-lyase [Thermoleophilaceae bacterium]|nr:cystathionine gamma-lyase [Thermoleophilaceae bacterium]
MSGEGTRLVRAGLPNAEQGAPFLPGPTFAAPFHLSGDPGDTEFVYGRYGNPAWSAYERALSELDGGEAVLFASGMAAAAAVLLPSLSHGDVLVMPSDCYMHVRGLAQKQLARTGVEVRQVPTAEMTSEALPERLALLWLESPSNPGLDVCDISALAEAAHERGALVAVDNTFATPLGQRPLELGADFSVTSATKHLSGHADLLLGYVSTGDPTRAEGLRDWRKQAGAIAGPFEVWLAHRSLATLALRLERGCRNAQALAELLIARDDVVSVRYPGLPADPAHQLALRQMTLFGTIVSFDLGSRERAEGFLAGAELVTEATSFGGLQTSAERRARWGGDDVPEGFIRMSAGCEDTADLVADLEQALGALA